MSEYTYVGRKPCGCVMWAAVDVPHCAKTIAKEMAYSVKHGEAVDRLPVEQVREMPWKCEAHKKPPDEDEQQGTLEMQP